MDPAFVAAAEAAADAAGAIIRPLFRAGLDVEAKGDASPVTAADRGAEQAMRTLLADRLPAHGVLGEEFGPDRLDAEWVWTLDPIDGTRAFVTGRPIFATLVGLLHRGCPVLGIVDQPVTGERWVGVAGAPTRFIGPLGGVAGCRPCPELGLAELSCTSPEMFAEDEAARFAALRARVRRVTFGGDAYAYGLLALGAIDVVAEAGLKPWDWAALVPVIEGAGGRCTDWAGATLHLASGGGGPSYDAARQVIAVGDPSLLSPAVAALRG